MLYGPALTEEAVKEDLSSKQQTILNKDFIQHELNRTRTDRGRYLHTAL